MPGLVKQLPSETPLGRMTPGESKVDPCVTEPFSLFRFAVLALLFVTIWGGIFLLILMADKPYGIQLSSMLIYTAAVALYTFSRNRNGMQSFLISCPVVRGQLPRLIRRHVCFLAAVFTLQTTALELRPNIPASWVSPSSRNPSPFAVVVGCICTCLAIVQVLTNRSLLQRAHDDGERFAHFAA